MKIAKYIGDLIFDYECVVIPGLGGFISTEKSAVINVNTNQFAPPSKEIHFNVHLKANDGLLISYVARNEGISFKSAKQKIDKFVLLCNNALEDGKRISFSKIGFIFQDEEKNIVFKQDETINYNADAFGMSSFISPAIRRSSSEEKIKEVFAKKTSEHTEPKKTKKLEKGKKDRRIPAEVNRSIEMIARKKPSKVKQQLAFVFAILFAMGSYYTFNNYHSMLYYWNRYQVRIPFLYSSPNDYLAANAGILSLEKINVSNAGWLSGLLKFNESTDQPESSEIAKENVVKTDNNSILDISKPDVQKDLKDSEIESEEVVIVPAKEKELLAANKEIRNTKPAIKQNIADENVVASISAKQFRFFIIAGSFKNETNALKFVSSLKNQGYDALIADTNSYGMFRVAFMGFTNMAEAEKKLVAVRRESNPQAWILTK
jgi:cell division septation protein DedD